jgi:hypothetical protein
VLIDPARGRCIDRAVGFAQALVGAIELAILLAWSVTSAPPASPSIAPERRMSASWRLSAL